MPWQSPYQSPDFVHTRSCADAFLGVRLVTFEDGFQCYTHTSTEETELIYNEIFIKREYLRHLPPLATMKTVVDIGANIGIFTLLAKRENPAMAVYAFEPMKATYDTLLRNMKLHHLSNVTALNVAIGAQDHAVRTFTYYPNMAGNSTANPNYKETQRAQMQDTFGKQMTEWAFTAENKIAPVRTLSATVKEYQLSSIDLLKIDTEGDESLVLDGTEESDFRIVRNMVIETHTETLHDSISARLQRLGYKIESDTGLSAFPGVGNLYATKL